MIINLEPRLEHKLTNAPTISLSGLVLTIDGIDYDLSVIPHGGQSEGESPFVGICTRDEVTIEYPYSTDIYELNQPTDRSAYRIELLDGETLQCPLIKREVQNDV